MQSRKLWESAQREAKKVFGRCLPGAGRPGTLHNYFKFGTATLLLWNVWKYGDQVEMTSSDPDQSAASKFLAIFNPERTGFQVEDFKKVLANPEVLKDEEQFIVFLEPYLYNEKFLQEVLGVISKQLASNPNTKVFTLSQGDLTSDELSTLSKLLSGKEIPEETLFLIRREQESEFDALTFKSYFQNKDYLSTYFTRLKLIGQNNSQLFREHLKAGMKEDQMFVMAVLPEKETASAKRKETVRALKNIMVDYPVLSSDNIGLMGCEASISEWIPGVKEGDIVLIQKQGLQKMVQKDTPETGDSNWFEAVKDQNIYTIIKGGLDRKGEDIFYSIVAQYARTNVFYHPEMFYLL